MNAIESLRARAARLLGIYICLHFPLIALIDESAYLARGVSDSTRLEARRASWREALGGSGVAIVFVDLAAPDLLAVESALDGALEAPAAATGVSA